VKNRTQKIRLGIFLVISLSTLFSIIFFFTAREFFEKEDVYFVSYEGVSVTGLDIGSPVKYMGINVGRIQDMRIDPENVNRIIVTLGLKPETPIKENARADITSLGITGLKAIEISGASNEAKSLNPGSYIQAGSSFTGEITGKAENIAQKAELVLNNLITFTQPENLNKITGLADQAGTVISNIDSLIAENRKNVRQTVDQVKKISEQMDETTQTLRATIDIVQLKIRSDTVNEILANLRDITEKLNNSEINALVENISVIASQTDQLIDKVGDDLDRSSMDFSESLKLLKLTLENLNEASIKINQDPSILLRGVNARNIPDNELNR
jgi:phospholipid/cholesterol/gamma-HCH transport system substrate-binding protein